MTDDFAVEASRATEPYFFRAPVPEHLPNGMVPMEFQFAGAEYALGRNHALIGDAPGLTKTAQSVMVDNAIESKRTLCVVPASLILNWEREIWNWSTKENVTTYPILTSKAGVSPEHDFNILSYDMLRNPAIFEALMALRWDHVIYDEAHALKDPKGNKRTRVICAPDALPSVVGRQTLLSGTILPNQPVECYNAVRLLDWDAIDGASLEDFREYYYEKGDGFIRVRALENGIWKSKVKFSNSVRNVPVNLDDLQRRLRSRIMVRRLKEQVLHELPPKVWHPFPLRLSSAISTALKHPGWSAAEKLYEMDPEAFDGAIPVDGEISTARRELGEAKAPAVADYIDDLFASGVRKLVVAAWHHTVLDYLKGRLGRWGLVYMDGRTGPAAKQRAVDDFQTRDEIGIILGQMIPLGEGWTLTAAQDAVLAEFYFVPGKNDQLLDRIHRMGQKGSYIIGHVPVLPGTLEERILHIAIQKDIHIHAALDKRH